ERLHYLEFGDRRGRYLDLCQRSGCEIARLAAADSHPLHFEARATRGNSAAHAVAKSQRARLRIEFEDGFLDSREREIIDPVPASTSSRTLFGGAKNEAFDGRLSRRMPSVVRP